MSALYLHVPYCLQKCSYCDFFSLAEAPLALADYAALLVRHLELAAGNNAAGPFETLFFGGGTPSLLTPQAVAAVLDAADRRFGIATDAELSLEANPGTVNRESLAGYRAAGINRLSIGLQSFSDAALRRLGRPHDAAQGRQAVDLARRAGFANLSCDLMFGLPGQDRAALDRELAALLELQPEHVSCYGLAAEPGTPLAAGVAAGDPVLPDEETAAGLYRQVHHALTAAGYGHYEISNFARPGRQCRHNLGYWRRRDCLGVGAGAHGFESAGYGRRLAVPDHLANFAAEVAAGRDPSRVIETFDRRGAMSETLYLGLRTAEGVSESRFRERFGQGVAEAFPAAVASAGRRLRTGSGRWRFDLDGWLLFDHLILPFL